MDSAGDARLPAQPHQRRAAEAAPGAALAEGRTRAQPGAAGHAASPTAAQPDPSGHAGAATAAQARLQDPALRMPMARLEAETAAVRRCAPASSSRNYLCSGCLQFLNT